MTGSDPEVMSFDGSHLEVAVEGLYIKFWVRLSSYRVVTRKRWQSRTGNDVTYPHVAESDPEVASFDRKSPGSGVEGL